MRSRWLLPWCAGVIGLVLLGRLWSNPGRVQGSRANGPDLVRPGIDASRPLSVIVFGDTRFTDPEETSATNPKVRRWLVDKIAEEKPDAVLVTGDLPWHGGAAGDYAVYLAETKVWRDAHLLAYPALGNHEFVGREQECLENWWRVFPELRGLRWYSVRLSDSVYSLNLDSNSSLLPGSPQIDWIGSQLAHLPSSVRFVLIDLHHPPVVDVQPGGDPSHNGRPNEHALAEFLAQAQEKTHARFIVAAGHVHNYERFNQDGIVYLVSGGGGARPYAIVRTPADLYQSNEFPNYHYLKFVFEGNKLTATMIRVANPEGSTPQWEEKDRFAVQAAEPPSR
ncbi:MAG: metallophosphoesterase [Terriglobia bacterium]|jgi:3',5'-cyclic AMP phosphodiesterase CpdA